MPKKAHLKGSFLGNVSQKTWQRIIKPIAIELITWVIDEESNNDRTTAKKANITLDLLTLICLSQICAVNPS